MTEIRFSSKADLIAALEARRPWAEALDKTNMAEHQKAEQAYLKKFRDACREAIKWDYKTAQDNYFAPMDALRYRRDTGPTCPRSAVARLDRILNVIKATRQERFVISASGCWGDAHWVLTYDPSITDDLCA